MERKPHLSFWQIWNMCFGFLGIQFGLALQNANVSRIFQTLGAEVDQVAGLWIAAPLTGLLVQPIVGYFSDRTWTRLGRRRPYFLAGAIVTTLALFVMPNSPALWIAAGTLWILDASINISMEPFRAFVGDQLPARQRPTGFAMQSFFIGVGSVVASLLPWLLAGALLATVIFAQGWDRMLYVLAGMLGGYGVLLLLARALPPGGMLPTIVSDMRAMPSTMRRLAVVQFFSWFALFAMWIYSTAAVAQVHFGSTDPTSVAYNEGANWVGVLFAAYNGFAALAAMAIPWMVRTLGTRVSHLANLVLGGIGLLSVALIRDPQWLLLSMLGVGFAWASILSLPYVMLSESLPARKMGVYMGIFNFFIVIPQIVAASLLGFLLRSLFGGQPVWALSIGGASLILAGLCVLWVRTETSARPVGAGAGE